MQLVKAAVWGFVFVYLLLQEVFLFPAIYCWSGLPVSCVHSDSRQKLHYWDRKAATQMILLQGFIRHTTSWLKLYIGKQKNVKTFDRMIKFCRLFCDHAHGFIRFVCLWRYSFYLLTFYHTSLYQRLVFNSLCFVFILIKCLSTNILKWTLTLSQSLKHGL